jgi:hypothetical protein
MVADIPAENTGTIPKTWLGVKTLSKCLRALPYERLIIRRQLEGGDGLILTNQEDTGYYGIIMGLK